MTLTATFKPQTVTVQIDAATVGASLGTPVVKEYLNAEAYEGIYDLTPSDEEQVLLTAGKRMTQNVTVGAIPSNYGLITWDGSTLTVS